MSSKSKDTLEYLFELEPIHANRYGIEVSIPEGIKLVSLQHDWVEFGVFVGTSSRLLLKKLPKNTNLYLFDSFEGLPEDWDAGDRIKRPKGYFALKNEEIPKFNDGRVKMMKGWFKDSIPIFVKKHSEPLALIHIDCDTYSSTICVLDGINDIIIPGTVVIFDELYNYPQYLNHEYRALQEFQHKHHRKFQYCGRSDKWAAWLKIIE